MNVNTKDRKTSPLLQIRIQRNVLVILNSNTSQVQHSNGWILSLKTFPSACLTIFTQRLCLKRKYLHFSDNLSTTITMSSSWIYSSGGVVEVGGELNAVLNFWKERGSKPIWLECWVFNLCHPLDERMAFFRFYLFLIWLWCILVAILFVLLGNKQMINNRWEVCHINALVASNSFHGGEFLQGHGIE